MDWYGLFLSILSIVGTFLVTYDIKLEGCYFWIVANAGWIIYCIVNNTGGQIPMWIIYTVIAGLGIYREFKKRRDKKLTNIIQI